MKKTGAFLAVYALEQIGVTHTFGIPGVHTTELYDALAASARITPVLVTHEGGGAFMADAISRTTERVGALVIVPAAGMTHALSGIGEAYLDGIPLLVLSGGIRRDTGRAYQLHDVDQARILAGLTKRYTLVERHADVIPAIYDAYRTAVSGEPGPVFVELPVEIQMFQGEVADLPRFTPAPAPDGPFAPAEVGRAVDLLTAARAPGLYVGWGAMGAYAEAARLADRLVAPVATTLQGLSACSARHPFHTGVGFGASALPAARKAFAGCDALLAVGVRFAELATGSYGMPVPDALVHVDVNPEVFNRNYPARVALEGDARPVLRALLGELDRRGYESPRPAEPLARLIAAEKRAYLGSWTKARSDRKVSPGFFFEALRRTLADDALLVLDDGQHTFLAAELFPVYSPRGFISPTDFNCMGYCVPAALGAKLARPERQVAAVVGDGAFLMTGMELLTGVTHRLGVMVFVFHDGELGQIAQLQQIPLARKTCTVLGAFKVEGVALATGAHFLSMRNDHEIDAVLEDAVRVSATGRPVLVDVAIDYSRRTLLTKGVVKTNLSRFPAGEQVRFVSRAVKRHLLG